MRMFSNDRIRILIVLLCMLSSPLLQAAPGRTGAQTSLVRFLQSVLESNPKVLKAKAAVDEAKAIARDRGLPIYNPALELEHERTDIETNSIGVTQAIDWRGKRRTRAKIGNLKLQVAKLEYQLVRLQTGVALLVALTNYQKAAALYKLAQKRLRIMTQLKNLAAKRFRAGDLSPVERDLTTLAFVDAQTKKNQANINLVHAEQQLVNVVGSKLTQWPAVKHTQIPKIDGSVYTSDESLYSLPMIRISQLKIQVAQNEIKLEKKRRSGDPTIGIKTGEEGREKLTGFTFSMPLNVRNTGKAKVQAANALYIQAKRQGQQEMRNARSSIRSSEQGYALTLKAWKVWRRTGKTSLARRYHQLQRLWQARELSTTDYLIQVKQTLETESSGIELKNRLIIAWTHWLKATAGLERWLQSAH